MVTHVGRRVKQTAIIGKAPRILGEIAKETKMPSDFHMSLCAFLYLTFVATQIQG